MHSDAISALNALLGRRRTSLGNQLVRHGLGAATPVNATIATIGGSKHDLRAAAIGNGDDATSAYRHGRLIVAAGNDVCRRAAVGPGARLGPA